MAADVASAAGDPGEAGAAGPGVVGVQVYVGSSPAGGAKGGTPSGGAAVDLPDDIVNQTAGDVVCQQANPALITR